jgi:hypothetical protein
LKVDSRTKKVSREEQIIKLRKILRGGINRNGTLEAEPILMI